jgi:hypothetical protein
MGRPTGLSWGLGGQDGSHRLGLWIFLPGSLRLGYKSLSEGSSGTLRAQSVTGGRILYVSEVAEFAGRWEADAAGSSTLSRGTTGTKGQR